MSPHTLSSIDALEGHVRAIAAAATPAEVFRSLLEAAAELAPRTAVFLVRHGRARGWSARGYDAAALARLRTLEVDVEGADPQNRLQQGGAPDGDPGPCRELDFGQPPAEASSLLAVRVRERPLAIVLLERPSGSTDVWEPRAATLLVHVAQLRLELDLVQRKLRGVGRGAAGETEARESAPLAGPSAERPSRAASPEAREITPAEPAHAGVETKQMEAARRFAKLVATDIRIYNEQAVILGRQHGDLVARLGEHLARGKQTFLRRHGTLGPEALGLLHEAYVAVLAGGDAQLLPADVLVD